MVLDNTYNGKPAPAHEVVPLGWIKLSKRNARKHSAAQIDEIAASIKQSGAINPLIVNGDYRLIAGEGRYLALKKLGHPAAPVIVVRHLSEAEERAYAIADNRLAEKSTWDIPALALELQEVQVINPDLDLRITGFSRAKIETLTTNLTQTSWSDLDKPIAPVRLASAVTRLGDMWRFSGDHRLIAGDSTDRNTTWQLIGSERVRSVVTDPPFNRDTKSYSGKGRHQHANFAMGHGEFSSREFTHFLAGGLAAIKPHLEDGALLYAFMDGAHVHELLDAGREQELALKTILVWDKGKSGLGSPYRSGHELICLFKWGKAPHIDNIELGANGRDRSTVLRYAGMNSFGGGRDQALAMHPTVKPVQMIADLLLDTSHRGEIIYDGFGGSGTTLIAAHKMERRARLVELDPGYCDTIIQRFIRAFGEAPTLAETGQTYEEVRAERASSQGGRHGEEA